jgi:hypothetical protein
MPLLALQHLPLAGYGGAKALMVLMVVALPLILLIGS